MKIQWKQWGFVLLLSGGLMAEQLPQHWVTIKEEKTGLEIDFPHQPLEMTFDIPFQNTPPAGQLQVYSVPTQAGVLVLSVFLFSDN